MPIRKGGTEFEEVQKAQGFATGVEEKCPFGSTNLAEARIQNPHKAEAQLGQAEGRADQEQRRGVSGPKGAYMSQECQQVYRSTVAPTPPAAPDSSAPEAGVPGNQVPSGYMELLSAFQQLEERSRRRTVALGTAAHQLKTPLAIIAGYVELLLTKKAGPLNERQRQILEESRFNCARLQQFIQDFLSYSALETGHLTMKLEVGDLNACLNELYTYWLSPYQKKGVALYFLAQKLPLFPFDCDKVQHVVPNLLENSLKFTPPGGTVWLTAEPYVWERRTHQESRSSGERRSKAANVTNAARVTVSDTGPGIAPEYHQEIFDDFVKVSPQSEEAGGMGLGLAIARRLVLAHAGKIWVESDPGSGSTFCFLLPLKPF
jgi:signal transduction histidine kinase